MLCLTAEPNITHKKLAELEAAGKVKAVVTQNIDGLHQLAGSKRVLELHGSVHRNYCRKCGKGFDAEYVRDYPGKVPLCDACGGTIKPDVVLYEEGLDQQTLEDAVFYISHADLLIIGELRWRYTRRPARSIITGKQTGVNQQIDDADGREGRSADPGGTRRCVRAD